MSQTKVAEDQLLPELVFRWKGPWATGQAYPVNSLVRQNGSVYISIVDQSASNSTTCPESGENWELCWELFAEGVGAIGSIVTRETPSGSVNGSNQVFTLTNTLMAGSEQVFLNGILQEPGGSNDYTVSGQNITFVTAPETGDRVRVTYLRA